MDDTNSQQGNDNFVKSIIYGNQIQNSYGKFRAFCSALSSKEQIDKIIWYLREKDSFRKYNKIVYAYRLYQRPTFFVTQDEQNINEPKLIEGFNEDTTIEGSGEKLIHLLQKFNVENVLIIVGIEQFDPLSKFESSYFGIIVERAKDLLNTLYTRVVQSEIETSSKMKIIQDKGYGQKQPLKMKKKILDLPQIEQTTKKIDRKNNRPNHFYAQGKPKFLEKKSAIVDQESYIRKKQINELNRKLKEQAYNLEKILASLDQKDYLQLRFTIQYDQNRLADKVLQMLMIITNIESREQLIYDYNLKEGLEAITVNDLNNSKVKKINDMLRGDKRLTLDVISQQIPSLAPIFAFIIIIVKSYENGKRLNQLEYELLQNSSQFQEQSEFLNPSSLGYQPPDQLMNINQSNQIQMQQQFSGQEHNDQQLLQQQQQQYQLQQQQGLQTSQQQKLLLSSVKEESNGSSLDLTLKPKQLQINKLNKIKLQSNSKQQKNDDSMNSDKPQSGSTQRNNQNHLMNEIYKQKKLDRIKEEQNYSSPEKTEKKEKEQVEPNAAKDLQIQQSQPQANTKQTNSQQNQTEQKNKEETVKLETQSTNRQIEVINTKEQVQLTKENTVQSQTGIQEQSSPAKK